MRTRLALLLFTLSLALSGCTETVETKTQVTLRIQVDDAALFARMTDVRISLYRKESESKWVGASTATLEKSKVRWPLDLPILPGSASSLKKPFEAVVEALEGDIRLTQTRVVSSYVEDSVRVLEVWLFTCPGKGEGSFCSDDTCHGPDCLGCDLAGGCAAVGVVNPEILPMFSATESPAIKPPPAAIDVDFDAGVDGGNGEDAPDSGEVVVDPMMTMTPDAMVPMMPTPVAPATCTPACSASAECVVSGTVASCKCLSGFEDRGAGCVDIDECKTSNGGCSANATCQNTAGSRSCACKPGFDDKTGDGTECTDKCAAAGCDPNATCSIVGSTATCSCPSPYVGDGKTCTFDQSCSLLKCDAHATCAVTGTMRECKCGTGYTGNGTTCTDVNECTQATNPCGANSVCTNTAGAYTCGCVTGFRRNGNVCENIPDCTATSCMNGGTCSDGINMAICSCGPNFSGDRCQTNNDNCPGHMCLNGGLCVDGVGNYSCNCANTGFDGNRCQSNVPDCPSATGNCLNGGTCVDGIKTTTCACTPNFTGLRCETNRNDCPAVDPCLNGSRCVDGVGTFSCGTCPAGFKGERCEQETCTAPTISITSTASLTQYRNCWRIVGDLNVATLGPGNITAAHFPYLTDVTGAVRISAFASGTMSNPASTITFDKLRTVGGEVMVGATNPQFLQAHFPSLTSAGSLRVLQTGITAFTAPQLTTISGNMEISSVMPLCTFDVRRVSRIGGTLYLESIINFPSSSFSHLRTAAGGRVMQNWVGCCFIGDNTACEGFTPDGVCNC